MGKLGAFEIILILAVVLLYTTLNLLRKNERAEDIVVGYLIYLDQISKVIEASDEKLKKIDQKESFKEKSYKTKYKNIKNNDNFKTFPFDTFD